MVPANSDGMENCTGVGVRNEKTSSASERGSSGLQVYQKLDRSRQRKWREIWKWAFMQEKGAKEKLRVCEVCYRIDRKAERKEGCKEEHQRLGTMELKEIYGMRSVADMVDYFESIWREDGERSKWPLEVPNIGLKRQRKEMNK